MNKVILLGRLTRDVELNMGKEGTAYARASIAVDRKFSKSDEADFFNLVAFGKTAEFLSKYFGKGSRVLIEGRLRFSQYEDKQGAKKSSVEIVVDNAEFADGKNSGEKKQGTKNKDDDKDFPGTPVNDEDTPF